MFLLSDVNNSMFMSTPFKKNLHRNLMGNGLPITLLIFDAILLNTEQTDASS